MNRQNNLKIIITTVIVLVISAIAVFTVVNWAEIVRKFQGAAAKNDGFEKHERNTVPQQYHWIDLDKLKRRLERFAFF